MKHLTIWKLAIWSIGHWINWPFGTTGRRFFLAIGTTGFFNNWPLEQFTTNKTGSQNFAFIFKIKRVILAARVWINPNLFKITGPSILLSYLKMIGFASKLFHQTVLLPLSLLSYDYNHQILAVNTVMFLLLLFFIWLSSKIYRWWKIDFEFDGIHFDSNWIKSWGHFFPFGNLESKL